MTLHGLNHLVKFRPTVVSDLGFVLQAESHPGNVRFISQWSRSLLSDAIASAHEAHYMIERKTGAVPVGFLRNCCQAMLNISQYSYNRKDDI